MRDCRLLWVLLVIAVAAQASPRIEVKRGNIAAQDSLHDAALMHYKKALEQHADTSLVLYDLGNLMYQKGDFENAEKSYLGAFDPEASPTLQSDALYNLGNSYFETQKFDKAVAAYTESLKRDPKDSDAKYNLELAKRMLQQQQQQKQQEQKENQNQEEKQEEQQQQQQQKPDSNQQEQKQEDQQPDQQQQQEQQQQEQQQQQMSDQPMNKEEAERLLNALLNNEQNTLKDVKKVKVAARKKREKDW